MKMKRKGLFLLILAALVFSACQSLFVEDRAGQAIRFSASAGNGIGTRTSYSGDKDDITNKERIDWSDGDRVKVYLYLDNAPGYKWDHISSDYIVTLIGEGNPNYISKGNLSSAGTSSLKWVGTADDHVAHWFYSVYPADYRGELYKDTDGSMKVDFNGLANQDGTMNYAYMAAVVGEPYYTDGKENPNSNRDMIDLDYYPMITTVYVTVENASGKDLNLSIRLSSKEDTTPLAGPYTVVLNGKGSFTPIVNTKSGTFVDQLNQSLSLGTSGEAAKKSVKFFLLPVNYTTSNLNLTLSDGNKPYSFDLNESGVASLQAFHKYNVSVKLNKGDQAEYPSITEASEGLSQLVCAILREMCNGGMWDLLEDFFRALGFQDTPDGKSARNHFEEEFYNPFSSDIDKNNSNKEGWKDLVSNYLTEESWSELLDCIGELEEINLKTSPGVLADTLKAKDMKIFKKAKTISLYSNSDLTLEIENLPNLETLEISDGSNGNKDISITDCANLTTVIVPQNAHLRNLRLVRTPNFKKAEIQNSNNSNNVSIYLEDCSTNVQDAYIRFFNQNLRPTVERTGNTKNVVVECGYYDMVQWWPPIYGDWYSSWRNTAD